MVAAIQPATTPTSNNFMLLPLASRPRIRPRARERASPAPQGSQYRLTKGKRQDSRTAVTASLHASHNSRASIHPRCRCNLSRLVGRTGKMACRSCLVCTLGKSGKPFFGVLTSRAGFDSNEHPKGALMQTYGLRVLPLRWPRQQLRSNRTFLAEKQLSARVS